MVKPGENLLEERTLVLIKPNAVNAGNVDAILKRFDDKGFKTHLCKMVDKPSIDLLESHYEEHQGKPFFPNLIHSMSRGPIYACVFKRHGAIHLAREMLGDMHTPGTLRYDFGENITENAVHASDSEKSAEREIKLWFSNTKK